MKRKPINPVGQRGRMNKAANKLIREYAISKGMREWCEVNFDGCLKGMFSTIAHRHRRNYYKTAEELADPKQWIVACVKCHEDLDRRTPESNKLSEEVFNKLRGEE